jgi:hypothetical protein
MLMVRRVLLAGPFFIFILLLAASASPADLPAGQVLHCRLATTLSTGIDKAGDPFSANIAEPLLESGRQVIPLGALLEGHIASLDRPGHLRGVGHILLSVESLRLPTGRSVPVRAVLVGVHGAQGVRVVNEEGQIAGPSSRLRTMAFIGGGTAAGGLAGAIFHAIPWGMVAGGAAGLVSQARQRGKDLNLPAGTLLDFELSRNLALVH